VQKTTRPRFAIGTSDFRKLRESGSLYVDKTSLIQDIVDSGAEVLLFPRPRRYGKTLNLSMLRYFLEKRGEDLAHLFAGLTIEASEAAREHFQRYPVIFLTFKDVKARSWGQCFEAMADVLARAYQEHDYLLDSGGLKPRDAEAFAAILSGRATEVQCWKALADLSRHLHMHHGERVVLLVDEYDTPIHAGFSGDYYDEAVTFFRSFLSGGLEDNPHLHKGVLTGILRVAQEGALSGLSNLAVYSVLRPELSASFGFTEAEVARLTRELGEPELLDGIRAWYNGYLFGGRVIYSPWSVLSYLDSADREPRPYWVSTGSGEIVQRLLFSGPDGLQ